MLSVLRSAAWRLAPGVMANRAVRWQAEQFPERDDAWEVEAGPFAGLRYPEGISTAGASEFKRRGSYEEPVAQVLSAELLRGPAQFVDIGAAEGFYAVGVARRDVPTIAYESSSIQRQALAQLAKENGVDVTVRRHCRAIPSVPSGSVLLLDVEGAEASLLTRPVAERLAGSTVIVELHEQFVPGVTAMLFDRFESTHSGEVVSGNGEPTRTGAAEWAVFRPVGSDGRSS